MKYVRTFEQYLLESDMSYEVGDIVKLKNGTTGAITKVVGNTFSMRVEGVIKPMIDIPFDDIAEVLKGNSAAVDPRDNQVFKQSTQKISNDIVVHNYPNNPLFYGM